MPALRRVLGSIALLVALGLTVQVSAQEAPIELHGGWTATVGVNRTFLGTWTARVLPDKPNSGEGSWAVLNEGGQTILEGTWAANKTRFGWQGAWAARTLTGQSFSGTWTADIIGSSSKTFRQMLEWTLQKDILGSWRSGREQGRWRLAGSRQAAQGGSGDAAVGLVQGSTCVPLIAANLNNRIGLAAGGRWASGCPGDRQENGTGFARSGRRDTPQRQRFRRRQVRSYAA
jgi:hypothetical protein